MKEIDYGSNVKKVFNNSVELFTPTDNLSANTLSRPLENICSEQEDMSSIMNRLVLTKYNTHGVFKGLEEQLGLRKTEKADYSVEGFRTFKFFDEPFLRIPTGIIMFKSYKKEYDTFILSHKRNKNFARRRFAEAVGLNIDKKYNNVEYLETDEKGNFYLKITKTGSMKNEVIYFPEPEKDEKGNITKFIGLPGEEVLPRFAETKEYEKMFLYPKKDLYKFNCLETAIKINDKEVGNDFGNKKCSLYYLINDDISIGVKQACNFDLSGKFFIGEQNLEETNSGDIVTLFNLTFSNYEISEIENIITLIEEDSVQDLDSYNNLTVTGKFDSQGKTDLRSTTINGNLTINGEIFQNGDSYIIHAEDLNVKDNFINLRDEAESGLIDNEVSGLAINNYNGAGDKLNLAVDANGEARLGKESGLLEPLLTRDEREHMANHSPIVWDSVNKRAKTINMPLQGANKVLVYKGTQKDPEFEIFKTSASWTGTREEFQEAKKIEDKEAPGYIEDLSIVNIVDDGLITNGVSSEIREGDFNPVSSDAVFKAFQDSFRKMMLDEIYPVGSYYWTESQNFNPTARWGGSWQRVKDKFILALGDEGNSGDVGGSKFIKVANLPPHKHYNSLSGSTGSDGKHRHGGVVSPVWDHRLDPGGHSINTVDGWTNTSEAPDHWHYASVSGFSQDGSTNTDHSTSTPNLEGKEFLPPYEKAYCWKRIE